MAAVATDFLSRVAGAPISWGVCEQPNWGIVLDPRRVLTELTDTGLHAIELGDVGFFPDSDEETKALLAEFDVRMLGGFVPLVLHDPDRRAEALSIAERAAARLAGVGGTYFVTAVVWDYDWSNPTPLDEAGFKTLDEGFRAVDEICAKHGLTQVLHPHLTTMVETKRDVDMALEFTSVPWVLDTGHLAIGGTDPLQFARDHADRVGLVHLKDISRAVVDRVMSRELTQRQAVDVGIFPPLGQGDLPIAEVVVALEKNGYRGWYVHEQDTAVVEVPPIGSGPVEDLRVSVDYLRNTVVPALTA